jgi:hypothetical protein
MGASIIFSDDFFGMEADSFLMRLPLLLSSCELCEIAEMQGTRIDLRGRDTLSRVAEPMDLRCLMGHFGFSFGRVRGMPASHRTGMR